ncbi:MAG: 2Fe-2S iron-sulfur cluster-binding protein [Candidatus Krumholzibacteriia bacterium]
MVSRASTSSCAAASRPGSSRARFRSSSPLPEVAGLVPRRLQALPAWQRHCSGHRVRRPSNFPGGAAHLVASWRVASSRVARDAGERVARKVAIRILDDPFETRANESILHALQVYALQRQLPAWGFARFCWNASCEQCVLDVSCGDGRWRGLACQTQVREGLRVHTLPEVLMWTELRTRPWRKRRRSRRLRR